VRLDSALLDGTAEQVMPEEPEEQYIPVLPQTAKSKPPLAPPTSPLKRKVIEKASPPTPDFPHTVSKAKSLATAPEPLQGASDCEQQEDLEIDGEGFDEEAEEGWDENDEWDEEGEWDGEGLDDVPEVQEGMITGHECEEEEMPEDDQLDETGLYE